MGTVYLWENFWNIRTSRESARGKYNGFICLTWDFFG